jgi:hypothetical protein
MGTRQVKGAFPDHGKDFLSARIIQLEQDQGSFSASSVGQLCRSSMVGSFRSE